MSDPFFFLVRSLPGSKSAVSTHAPIDPHVCFARDAVGTRPHARLADAQAATLVRPPRLFHPLCALAVQLGQDGPRQEALGAGGVDGPQLCVDGHVLATTRGARPHCPRACSRDRTRGPAARSTSKPGASRRANVPCSMLGAPGGRDDGDDRYGLSPGGGPLPRAPA